MMDPEDDMYIYGTMETDNNATWKYDGDRLKIKSSLPGAKGRFADLKFGELTLPNGETKRVVVKLNKRKSCMSAKTFLAHRQKAPKSFTLPYIQLSFDKT